MSRTIRRMRGGTESFPFSYSLIDTDHEDANASSFSFSAVFGATDAARDLILSIALRGSVTGSDVDTVTIGGVSATRINVTDQINTGGGDLSETSFWTAAPSGTGGTIAINCGSNVVYMGWALYRCINMLDPTTPLDEAFDITTPHAMAMSVTPGVLVLAAGQSDGSTSSWSDDQGIISQDYNPTLDGSNRVAFASGISAVTATETVTYTSSGNNNSIGGGIVVR